MSEIIEFSDLELDKFLRNFDPVSEKFDIDNKSLLYGTVYEYDKLFEPINYSKKDSISFIEDMCMVYGHNQVNSNTYLWRYKTAVDKLLNQFVHIESVSRLFNEHYIEFEWDMHSRLDFSEHKISYYRDHFFSSATRLFYDV